MLGGSLRLSSAHFSPVSMADDTVRQCWDVRRRGVSGLVRFPRFRAIAAPLPLVARTVQARNRRKRTNYALFTGQPLTGALLRLRATVNKVRMDPRFFTTSKTLRRAPACQRVFVVVERASCPFGVLADRASDALVNAERARSAGVRPPAVGNSMRPALVDFRWFRQHLKDIGQPIQAKAETCGNRPNAGRLMLRRHGISRHPLLSDRTVNH